MKLDFHNILNKNKGKIGLVAGLGPSLKPHLKRWESLSTYKDSYVTIACNRYYVLTELNADYWVISNSRRNMQISNLWSEITKRPNTLLIYADSVDLTPRNFVENKFENINYLPFDQRHNDSSKCGCGNCCNHIIDGRLTIQEYLQKISNSNEKYSAGESVILHSLAVAIIIGCNPIYISGVDFDYSGDGYVNKDNEKEGVSLGRTIAINTKDKVESDLRILKDIAVLLNIEIFTPDKDKYLNKIFDFKEP